MLTLDELDARWHQLSEEEITGKKEWRKQHPKETFREIEQALDERLARLRARMLQDTSLLSRVADVSAVGEQERPLCPQCGSRMEPCGQQPRELTTTYEQTIEL